MSEYAGHTEDAIEEHARRRDKEIAASEEAAGQAAGEQSPSPDTEIAQVHRSGRQHDHSDTAAYQRPQTSRRISGPRR